MKDSTQKTTKPTVTITRKGHRDKRTYAPGLAEKAMEPIIRVVQEHGPTEFARVMSKISGEEYSRQGVINWVKSDEQTRTEPLVGTYLLMMEAARFLCPKLRRSRKN